MTGTRNNETLDWMDEEERHLEEVCTTVTALNTTFNADTRVPPYVGIMFEIFPRMELELLTLELDLRIPENELENADLSVEVYTMKGSYELLKAYSESRWSLVTKGTAVLLPGGQGAIIPTNEFNPLKIESKERRSFYITMKQPYLDHNVMALQKTGELQVRTPELDLLVGVGYHSYKFPGDFDRLLDPQFAGVMHLRRTGECVLMTTTTTVEFIYLIEAEVNSELLSELTDAVGNAVDSLMEENLALQGYQTEFDLQISEAARSGRKEYTGSCPEDWNYCPENYVRSQVQFTHHDKLESGMLLYQLFRVSDEVNEVVEEQFGNRKVLYIGHESLSADVSVTLTGIPEGQKMDEVQLDYFEHVTTDFLSDNTDDTVSVLALEVSEQKLVQSTVPGRSRRLQMNSLQIEGKILGAQTSLFSLSNFQDEIEQTFRVDRDLFLDRLVLDGLRPSEINEENRIEYFQSLSGVKGAVAVHDVAEGIGAPTSATTSTGLVLALLVSFLGAGAVFGVWWFARKKFDQAQKKRDRREMIKFRKRRSYLDRKASNAPTSLPKGPPLQLEPREMPDTSDSTGSPGGKDADGSRCEDQKENFSRSRSYADICVDEESPSHHQRRSRSFGDEECLETNKGNSNRSLSAFLDKGDSERKISKQGSSMSIQSMDNPSVSYSIGNYSSAAVPLPPPRRFTRSVSYEGEEFCAENIPPRRIPRERSASAELDTGYVEANSRHETPMTPSGRVQNRGMGLSRSFNDADYSERRECQSPRRSPSRISGSPQGRGYQPSPVGRGYHPSPGGRGYRPSPGGRGYRPSPGGRGSRSPAAGRGHSPEGRGYGHPPNNQVVKRSRSLGDYGVEYEGAYAEEYYPHAGQYAPPHAYVDRGRYFPQQGRGFTRRYEPSSDTGGRGIPAGRGFRRVRSWEPPSNEYGENDETDPPPQHLPVGGRGPGGRGFRRTRSWDPKEIEADDSPRRPVQPLQPRPYAGRGMWGPGRGGRVGRGAPCGRGVRRVRSWDPGHPETNNVVHGRPQQGPPGYAYPPPDGRYPGGRGHPGRGPVRCYRPPGAHPGGRGHPPNGRSVIVRSQSFDGDFAPSDAPPGGGKKYRGLVSPGTKQAPPASPGHVYQGPRRGPPIRTASTRQHPATRNSMEQLAAEEGQSSPRKPAPRSFGHSKSFDEIQSNEAEPATNRERLSSPDNPRPSPGHVYHDPRRAPPTRVMSTRQHFETRNDAASLGDNPPPIPVRNPTPPSNKSTVVRSKSFDACAREEEETDVQTEEGNGQKHEGLVSPSTKGSKPTRKTVDV